MRSLLWVYRFLKYSRLTWNPLKLAYLARFPTLDVSFLEVHAGVLRYKGTAIDLQKPHRAFLLHGFPQVAAFLNNPRVQLFENDNGDVVLEVERVRLILTDWEELFIAHEVFEHGIYRVRLEQPYDVIDVGMNVATASLAFANDPMCERVSSYELFPPTFSRAEQNLALNADIARKITAVSYGLARNSSELELDYCPEVKGSTGLYGVAAHVRARERGLKIGRVKARVRSACDEIRRNLEESASRPVVLKLDCEGAEYEILDALAEAGLLQRMATLLIEWHKLGPTAIEAHLANAGFRWLSYDPHGVNHGMIYAWRPQT